MYLGDVVQTVAVTAPCAANNLFLSHTWCLGFPFDFSSHLRAKKYSCSPERRLGAGTALPLLHIKLHVASGWLANWPGALPGKLLTRITFMLAPETLPRTVEKHFPRRGKALNKPLNHIFLCEIKDHINR